MRVRHQSTVTVTWPKLITTSKHTLEKNIKLNKDRNSIITKKSIESIAPYDNMKMSQEISEYKSMVLILEQAKEKAVTKANAHYAAIESLRWSFFSF